MFRNHVFHVFMVMIFLQPVTTRSRKYSRVKLPNVRYTDILRHQTNTSTIQCLVLCDGTDGCSSINHNSDTGKCELTKHVPRILAPESADDTSWNVYYNDRYIAGVNAWQSSTFNNYLWGALPANLAIDGNRENSDQQNRCRYCSTTELGVIYWAMEMESVANVSYVIIYFRNNEQYNYRNVDLRLLISATRQDSDNNVGTDCATYIGPPESPAIPVNVTCTQPVTGKFLKIIQDNDYHLTLCEVEVYSV